MKYVLIFITFAATLFCTGCQDFEIPWLSLYPLYQIGDTPLEEGLAGEWYSNDSASERVTFRRTRNLYILSEETLTDGKWNENERFAAFLLRLDESWFLDLSASPGAAIRGHLFLKIRLNGGELQITSLNDEWLRRQVVDQGALSYLDIPNSAPVITAGTRDLQRFIRQHASDPDAFENQWIHFHRLSQ